jgi:Arc/MetJ-type ribon-helix-helix transcriptional regulator
VKAKAPKFRKGKDLQEARPLTVIVSDQDVRMADAAVLLGKAANRSQAVRQAIRSTYGPKAQDNA